MSATTYTNNMPVDQQNAYIDLKEKYEETVKFIRSLICKTKSVHSRHCKNKPLCVVATHFLESLESK